MLRCSNSLPGEVWFHRCRSTFAHFLKLAQPAIMNNEIGNGGKLNIFSTNNWEKLHKLCLKSYKERKEGMRHMTCAYSRLKCSMTSAHIYTHFKLEPNEQLLL
jgi:hypothetical protein